MSLNSPFDTIDHNILIYRHQSCFDITSIALAWFRSYLSTRSQSVRICSAKTPINNCTISVSSGFRTRTYPFLFKHIPISQIASAFDLNQQQHADDTQLYIAMSKQSQYTDLSRLEECLSELQISFCHNGLAFNSDKTNVILLDTTHRAKTLTPISTINVVGPPVLLFSNIKNLGVPLKNTLSLINHVSNISKSCYYHILSLRHICPSITEDVSKMIAYSWSAVARTTQISCLSVRRPRYYTS